MSLKQTFAFLALACCLLVFYGFVGNANGEAIAASLVACALFAGLGTWFGQLRTLEQFRPRAIPKGTRKNTILIVGLGRSGKSTLIETLLREFDGKSPQLTQDFTIVKSTHFIEKTGEYFEMHVTDYRGQDVGQLVSNFVKEQLRPNTPLRYGDINSLIIVVDLFGPEFRPRKNSASFFDSSRVKFHMGQWSTTALDAIFGLLEIPALKYVCLFINKSDLLPKGISPEDAKFPFAALSENLRARCSNEVQFDLRIGSATEGTGILGINDSLKNRLFRHSVPMSIKSEQS